MVYGFLFAFHSNYGSVVYHFRDKAIYWLKIAIFLFPLHPPAFGGVHVGILPYHLVLKKNCVASTDGEKSLMICLAAWKEYRRLTDKRTDVYRRLATVHSIAR